MSVLGDLFTISEAPMGGKSLQYLCSLLDLVTAAVQESCNVFIYCCNFWHCLLVLWEKSWVFPHGINWNICEAPFCAAELSRGSSAFSDAVCSDFAEQWIDAIHLNGLLRLIRGIFRIRVAASHIPQVNPTLIFAGRPKRYWLLCEVGWSHT